jgi:lipopolysaccharide/colanic/teichoic acid biosynthesis glycosyltransferase
MIVKRITDIVLAIMAMLLLWPVAALVAVLVRFDSPGPILFQQRRVGLGGREFVMLKFRSMRVRVRSESDSFEPGDTSRVTRVGRFLRRSKLDELPQLWNILIGDMSFVGPRPELRRWVDEFPQQWARVHQVRPGLTDPASLRFCNEESILAASTDPERMYREEVLPAKLELYDRYVRERTWLGDLALIARTPWVVLIALARSRKPTQAPTATSSS